MKQGIGAPRIRRSLFTGRSGARLSTFTDFDGETLTVAVNPSIEAQFIELLHAAAEGIA